MQFVVIRPAQLTGQADACADGLFNDAVVFKRACEEIGL